MKAFLLLLLFSTPALAGEVSFSLGSDVVHAKGLRIWTVAVENENSRFRYGRMGQDNVEVEFYGAERVWHVGRWSTSLGLVHIESLTPLNGTRWNFSLGLRYRISKKVFISYLHYSHGSGVGIERGRSNLGVNALMVGTRF